MFLVADHHLVGILTRRNLIVMFLAAEMMLQGISVSLVAWSRHHGDWGGQVLVTRAVFDNARQVLKGRDLHGVGELLWMNHGPYLLKGVDGALDICEAGEVGEAPLHPPADSDKAVRQVSVDGEPVLYRRITDVVPSAPPLRSGAMARAIASRSSVIVVMLLRSRLSSDTRSWILPSKA